METIRVRQFVVLVETLHLRKAAEIMRTSHGAFHRSLQVLQEEVGFPLYVLEGRSIVITAQGLEFYKRAKEFLSVEERFLAKGPKINPSFRIGTHETFATYLLAPYWRKYFKTIPLVCRELIPGRIEEAVALGQIDVGVTYEPAPRGGLDFVRLGRVEMQIYARRDVFRNTDSARLPFVAPVTPIETVPTGARGIDGWPDLSVSREVTYRMDMVSSALMLVAQGACAVFIPPFVARTHNKTSPAHEKIGFYENPKGLKPVWREIYLIQKKGTLETKNLRQLARLIRVEGLDNG